ncbi:MAG: hypothetical protein KAS32_23875 [Candidatus Peribacteraceae bacterium]|nr:hypothetical protein [Candidatus Peribacteraceae bacterium]
MRLEDIAKICYQTNKAYCETIGDNSQVDWNRAADWQRQSVFDGVMFHLEHPYAGPSGSHENWLRLKQKEGWVYGETKDTIDKIHPCMIPYDELPVEQQIKDALFVSIVKGLKKHLTKLE